MQSDAKARLGLVTDGLPTRGARGHHFAAVYERLREAILLGELEPGAITTQMALAEQYAVGRTPLREALRVLHSDGLVVNEPNRRVQVTSLTVSDAEELYTARILLEPAAVRQTVPGFTSRDDAEMLGYLAQMDHYGHGRDWAGLRAPHRAFHSKLCAAGGQRALGLIAELSDHAERYRLRSTPSRQHWMRRQAEHRALAAAAADRDPDRTSELLVAHYARTAAIVCHTLDPDFPFDRLRANLRSVAPAAEDALDEAVPRRRRSRARA
jgi:GntR family carbon starvation induced transcriptional regulator